MKKLRTILQYKYLYIILIIISLILVFIRTNIPKKSIYNSNVKEIIGIISNYEVNDNKIKITIDSKEDIIGYYNFDNNKILKYIKLGNKIKAEGKLYKVDSNSYREYLQRKSIFYNIKINKIYLLSKNTDFFYYMRNKVLDNNNPYVSTFILGNKSKLNKEIVSKYQELGVSHLFAISGMHISLITFIILFILRKLKINENKSLIITSLILIFYLIFVGFSPSVLRAILFFMIINIYKLLKIENNYLNIFGITLFISLLINPFFIYELSFQYSFTISLFLLMFSKYIITKNYLLKILYISLISFISSIPITLYNYNEINLLSPIYNIIYVPLVSIIVFPLSFISFFIPVFSPIFDIATNILELITNLLSNIKIDIIFKNMPIYFYFIYYVFIYIFINSVVIKDKIFSIFLVLPVLFHYFVPYIENEKYLIMIDVGQGDSFLLHMNNKNILIDTGGNKRYSIIKNTTIPLFKKYGISRVNYLILSHGDYDHMGEAINLVNNYKVDKVIFNCGEYNDLEKELIKVLDKKKIKYYTCIKELNIDNNKLNFLNTKEYYNENNNSNVIYTEVDSHKFLFMGDAGIEKEKDLLDKYSISDIDVFKVGHHGSKTSSSKEFIDVINPKYSIISVGKNNRYGHPNKEVLNNIDNSKIYRTDKLGTVIFRIKKNKKNWKHLYNNYH